MSLVCRKYVFHALTQLASDAQSGHHMSRVCVCVRVRVRVRVSMCIFHVMKRSLLCHENVSCMS